MGIYLYLLMLLQPPAFSGNPVFPGWYADPETAVFGKNYWIFPTYSARYKDQVFFDAFSSPDLVHWQKHGHILDTGSVRWARRAMWAPAITCKDGKYFFFFGANDIQNDSALGGVGVAVADRPQGPYRDYLGKPLIGAFHNGAQPIDQAVFQDKDGAYYMIYGGWRHCNIARLKDDFTGFIPFPDGSTFKEITPEGYVEGPYMIYRKGKYYFMWSEGGWTGPDYSVAYAMSDSPTGPFKRIGKILQQDMAVATGAGHHSVLHIPGTDDYYIVYHRRPLDETDANHREVCIDTMAFAPDGHILPVRITKEGVAARPLSPDTTKPIAYAASVQRFIAYQAPMLAFTHCHLADVVGLRVKPDQTVLVRDGVITAIGDAESIPVPAGATVVDCTGKSLLPGYVLMHEHMFYPDLSVNPLYVHYKQLPFTFPKLYLACGATTIRTAGSVEPYSDLALKRDIDLGKIVGPSIDVTAPYLEGKGGFAPQMHELSGPQEAKEFVNFWADQGCTSFKAYNVLDRPTLKAAIDAAHARGLKITGHLCSITYREAAEMGIDQLEHGFFASTDFIPGKREDQCISSGDPLALADPDSPAVKDLIHVLLAHKVILTSTLAVLEGLSTADSLPHPEVLAAMSPDTRDMFVKYYSHSKSALMNKSIVRDMQLEKAFADAGGLLTVGTDPTGNGSTLAGYGSLRAIELLVTEGWTPIEAIRIATLNGARALGLQDRIGSIEVGKTADLVVIDGDVSGDIHAIRNVHWVFRAGVGFDSKMLFDLVQGQVGKY